MKWVRRSTFVLFGVASAFIAATKVDGSAARAAAASLMALCSAVLILRLARWMELKNERWWAAFEEGRLEPPRRQWPAVLGASFGVAVLPRLLSDSPNGVQLACWAFVFGTCAACLYLFWNRSSLDPPEVRKAMGKE